ncbi:nuclear transport factor 2 family protein [Lentzea sp. PSKA42]|jgi:uncharacterized protein (TIGR02246 family)|uniref:Nuclear transport factor 2 family protein n=1 Tax=Lentzea indica TaxID=2604800 RepID=A0ABX1FMR1_9PSEU|nr:nuclear transport factor 2 family protein [Lentzea indica]NKE59981.1 nuclear transport factor 2 family protein [Lentzea indica]
MSQSMETTSREDLYDRVEINEILNRHQIYIDLKDADGYANLYAEDGRYESPFSSANGRAEIKAMFVRLAEQGFTKGKRHMSGPAMVDIAGNTATATSWYWVAETEQVPTVYATGTYIDTLRKIDGRWLITNRVQTLDPGALSNG